MSRRSVGADLKESTKLKELHQGFAGSWAVLLRHALNPSMGRSDADVLSAHGLRRTAQLPANCASLKDMVSRTWLFLPSYVLRQKDGTGLLDSIKKARQENLPGSCTH